jgi:hypothetical protein
MNRLWSTGIALALFCCGGQAFATTWPCKITQPITIKSDGTILLATTEPCNGSGLSVTFKNTSENTCSYKAAVLPTPSTPAITITSSSVTAYCLASSDAKFEISPPAPTTAIVGTPFDLEVMRTTGVNLVADTLTVQKSSGTAIAQFNPGTVSFAANEPSGTKRTFKVIFTQKGDGIGNLQVNLPSGTPLSQDIAVSSNTGTCANPVPPYAIDAVTAGDKMGTHRLIAAAATERASGAIRFKVSATPLTFKLYSPNSTTDPATVPVDLAVSSCPGDFAGDFAPGDNRSKCKVSGTTQNGVTIGGTNGCPVKPDSSYYLNVRAITPGRDAVFDLKAQ